MDVSFEFKKTEKISLYCQLFAAYPLNHSLNIKVKFHWGSAVSVPLCVRV